MILDIMPYIAKPIDRNQVMITTFDSLVEWNSIARVIDHFINSIDLAGWTQLITCRQWWNQRRI